MFKLVIVAFGDDLRSLENVYEFRFLSFEINDDGLVLFVELCCWKVLSFMNEL